MGMALGSCLVIVQLLIIRFRKLNSVLLRVAQSQKIVKWHLEPLYSTWVLGFILEGVFLFKFSQALNGKKRLLVHRS